jgi:hypothetical protein
LADKTNLTSPLFIEVSVSSQESERWCVCVLAGEGIQAGAAQLKKIAPSGERRENVWGISCEKSWFYVKKSYFFQ